jgi:hypothetical protein
MRREPRLFVIVGEAAVVVVTACFVLDMILIKFVPGEQPVLGAMMLLSAGGAAWWLFRKLQAPYPRREARSVAIAFGVFSPVSLGIAFPLGSLSGGYTELYLGSRFAFFGAFAGVVVVNALVSIGASAFVLWVTRGSPRIGE